MIMPNVPGKVKCPECGSDNIVTKWSFTAVVAWVGRLLGVRIVQIYDKKCEACGHEFQIFRK
jgi:ribosomal protein S27E